MTYIVLTDNKVPHHENVEQLFTCFIRGANSMMRLLNIAPALLFLSSLGFFWYFFSFFSLSLSVAQRLVIAISSWFAAFCKQNGVEKHHFHQRAEAIQSYFTGWQHCECLIDSRMPGIFLHVYVCFLEDNQMWHRQNSTSQCNNHTDV